MKRVFSVAALVLVFAVMATVFASCAPTISGTYYQGDKSVTKTYTEFSFSGKNVTIKSYVLGTAVWETEATYSLDKEKTKITIEVPDSAKDGAKAYSGEFSFEEGEDYIKIGVLKYTKA
ncbi:MAG: hypothetical protein E7675_02580 [Ruminococcaceae bacterium]|nr:hypothetical protein [Oscillospiraceae bacterium]